MRFLIILILSLGSMAASFKPNPGSFAGGLMIGSMTAVTGKYFLSKEAALDFGVGFGGYPGSALYLDYLWHIPGVFGTNSKFGRESSIYFGGGGGIAFWDDTYECGRWHCDHRPRNTETGVFIRGLVGVEWYAAPTRFGVFGELGPTILLSPATGSGLDVGIGGRWYF